MFERQTRRILLLGALAVCVTHGAQVFAAPDEIQVYTEEMDDPGQFGLEQHINYTLHGTQTPDYPGQMTTNHILQVTPEFSYGITKNLEAGLYIPFAFAPGGNAFLNALRVRLKYIAPRQSDENMFYGLNLEVGRDTRRVSDSVSGMEIRPIIGYRDARWLASFNPILNLGLASNVSRLPQFEPALKLTHRIEEGVRGGFEYYGTYGTLNHPLPSDQRGHTLYAVTDVDIRGFVANFGIGRGFVNATDPWVVKAILEVPLE